MEMSRLNPGRAEIQSSPAEAVHQLVAPLDLLLDLEGTVPLGLSIGTIA